MARPAKHHPGIRALKPQGEVRGRVQIGLPALEATAAEYSDKIALAFRWLSSGKEERVLRLRRHPRTQSPIHDPGLSPLTGGLASGLQLAVMSDSGCVYFLGLERFNGRNLNGKTPTESSPLPRQSGHEELVSRPCSCVRLPLALPRSDHPRTG